MSLFLSEPHQTDAFSSNGFTQKVQIIGPLFVRKGTSHSTQKTFI
jgi:hypothetical protein